MITGPICHNYKCCMLYIRLPKLFINKSTDIIWISVPGTRVNQCALWAVKLKLFNYIFKLSHISFRSSNIIFSKSSFCIFCISVLYFNTLFIIYFSVTVVSLLQFMFLCISLDLFNMSAISLLACQCSRRLHVSIHVVML